MEERGRGCSVAPRVATTHCALTVASVVLGLVVSPLSCSVMSCRTSLQVRSVPGVGVGHTRRKGPFSIFLRCVSRFTAKDKAQFHVTVCRASGAKELIGCAASAFVPSPPAAAVCGGDVNCGEDLPPGYAP